MLALHVSAGHDRNGNGKRGWIIVDSQGVEIAFHRDPGSGDAAIRAKYPGIVITTSMVGITPAEWRYQIGRDRDR